MAILKLLYLLPMKNIEFCVAPVYKNKKVLIISIYSISSHLRQNSNDDFNYRDKTI